LHLFLLDLGTTVATQQFLAGTQKVQKLTSSEFKAAAADAAHIT
jgi:hypothetical protein